jgi:copper chaperone CopZ
MPKKSVRVPNISCGHCVATIETELGEVEGVVMVNADQASKMVSVEWDEPPTEWKALRSKLVEINYPPEPEAAA